MQHSQKCSADSTIGEVWTSFGKVMSDVLDRTKTRHHMGSYHGHSGNYQATLREL